MKRFISVALIMLAACATAGTEITRTSHQIQMPHYSFQVPPDQGWYMLRPDEKSETAVVTKKLPPFQFEIRMMRNVILNKYVKTWSAEEVADDYRYQEIWAMTTLGVDKGLYRLRDVVQGEQIIGSKKFYTLTYTTFVNTQQGMEHRGALYLYFPKEDKNDWFLIAHFSEVGPAAEMHAKSLRAEFIKVLESVSVVH
jgi:hypothetical protein